ncbi:hypothetical protein EBX31_12440 [bacterium]|nr:hypothetical protein [bacterium]
MQLLNKKFTIVAVVGLVVLATGWFFSSSSFISSKFAKVESATQAEVQDKGKRDHAKTPASSSVAARDYQKNQNQNTSVGTTAPVPPRTTPLAATPLDEISKEEEKRFPGAKVVSSAEVAGPGAGQVTRVRILETDFKYPYLRTEEVVDPASGQVVSREEMVADHVLVTLKEGEDPGALLAALGGTDIQMERVSPGVPLFRLHLGTATLEAVPAALDALDEKGSMVQMAEPDFIRQSLLAPNDPKYVDGTLWGLNQISDADIDAPEGWDIRSSAGNVIVAVGAIGTAIPVDAF